MFSLAHKVQTELPSELNYDDYIVILPVQSLSNIQRLANGTIQGNQFGVYFYDINNNSYKNENKPDIEICINYDKSGKLYQSFTIKRKDIILYTLDNVLNPLPYTNEYPDFRLPFSCYCNSINLSDRTVYAMLNSNKFVPGESISARPVMSKNINLTYINYSQTFYGAGIFSTFTDNKFFWESLISDNFFKFAYNLNYVFCHYMTTNFDNEIYINKSRNKNAYYLC